MECSRFAGRRRIAARGRQITLTFNTTYATLPGTSGTTLVGEAANGLSAKPRTACRLEHARLSLARATPSAGPARRLPSLPQAQQPFGTNGYRGTGITTTPGQHICGIIGEYGDDSASKFPGAQFIHMVDDKGNALNGAPALVPWLNRGTANATGYTVASTRFVPRSLSASIHRSLRIRRESKPSPQMFITQ